MAKIHAKSRLGDYFVAFKLATRKQVDQCHKSLVPGQMIGHALAKVKICSAQTCETVALVQKKFQKTAPMLELQGVQILLDEKAFVGEILVALGFITPEQKDVCLNYQEAERAKGNNPGRLGEVVVALELCSETNRDLAMKVQDWLRGVK
jgi:hypothetical protein